MTVIDIIAIASNVIAAGLFLRWAVTPIRFAFHAGRQLELIRMGEIRGRPFRGYVWALGFFYRAGRQHPMEARTAYQLGWEAGLHHGRSESAQP
jgi:hypothetical protein